MATHAAPNTERYFVPAPSVWPFVLTAALISLLAGVSSWLENDHVGPLPIYFGGALAIAVIFLWFRDVVGESEGGHYGAQVDRTYRWAMARSEEHTSELQSLMRISYAVFCLKTKKHKTKHAKRHTT